MFTDLTVSASSTTCVVTRISPVGAGAFQTPSPSTLRVTDAKSPRTLDSRAVPVHNDRMSLSGTIINVDDLELSARAKADVSMPSESFISDHHAYQQLMLGLAANRPLSTPLLTTPHTPHTPPTPWIDPAIPRHPYGHLRSAENIGKG